MLSGKHAIEVCKILLFEIPAKNSVSRDNAVSMEAERLRVYSICLLPGALDYFLTSKCITLDKWKFQLNGLTVELILWTN